MHGADPLAVGILTEPYLHEWQVAALDRLRAETDVEIPLVVYNASNVDCEAESWNSKDRIDRSDVTQFFDALQREKAWLLVRTMRTVARVLGDEPTLWYRHSIENVDALTTAEHVPCEPRTDDGWNEFPDEVVDRLADDCDVVVRFGFGLVRGAVLTAPEYGVLSFHPADIRSYRGMGPPAIFHDGQDRAGATLQRLTESIDAGEIVAYDEVSLQDCYTVWDVFDRLAIVQTHLLAEGISNLSDPTFEPQHVPDEQLGEFYSRDLRRSLSFSGRILAKNAAGRIRRRLAGRRPVDDTIDRQHLHSANR